MKKTFRLDRTHGKLMGVCAGLANFTGIDATIVRIAAVVATLAFPWTILAYLAMAWVAKASGPRSTDLEYRRPSGSIHSLRTEMSDTDHRLAEIERYVASPNNRLAREIDALR